MIFVLQFVRGYFHELCGPFDDFETAHDWVEAHKEKVVESAGTAYSIVPRSSYTITTAQPVK